MFNRLAAALLLLCGISVGAVDPARVAGKVHSPTPRYGTERIGTAWCLNKDCSLMVTNYHVAKLIGNSLTINGEVVASVSLATGPDDNDARDVPTFTTEVFRYASVRDLALLKMRSPMMSKGMHGVRV